MTTTEETNPQVLGLLWLRPEPAPDDGEPSRGELSELLIRVADAEGLEAVTVDRVRAELGDAAAGLDRHVRYETDLADLLLDALFARIELPPVTGADWRADLRSLAWQTWELLKQHPWLAVLIVTRPMFSPHTLAYLDRSFAILEGRGLDRKSIAMLAGYVTQLGVGPILIMLHDEEAKKKLFAKAPPTGVDMHAIIGGFIQSVVSGGRYPALGAFLGEGSPHASPDESFSFALDAVLDGIARRIGTA